MCGFFFFLCCSHFLEQQQEIETKDKHTAQTVSLSLAIVSDLSDCSKRIAFPGQHEIADETAPVPLTISIVAYKSTTPFTSLHC